MGVLNVSQVPNGSSFISFIAIPLVLNQYHTGSHAAVGSGQQEYSEDYEQQRGKGSFPAMITPAYQRAKKANQLASQVSVPVLIFFYH